MKPGRAVLSLTALVLSSFACSDITGTSEGTTITALDGGNGQSALRGTGLEELLQVRVERHGVPIGGVRVTWRLSAGDIIPTANFTNASGVASAKWILGNVPGLMSVTATIVGTDEPKAVFTATALPLITLQADPASNDQTGLVGTPLFHPLRVTVLAEGIPKAGLEVTWAASAGSVPASTISDAGGTATAPWVLGQIADTSFAYATVGTGSSAEFRAIATPGAPALITQWSGDGQALPANYPEFPWLIARVTDTYGNPIEGVEVDWAVGSGPVVVRSDFGLTDANGLSKAIIAPTGLPGAAKVEARLANAPAAADFSLTVTDPSYLVVLDPNVGAFISDKNGSMPAVDTIPVGRSMTWLLSPFDYDYHNIVSVGTPSFVGGPFPYASPSQVVVWFTVPGTYRYVDEFTGYTGVIVVQ
jgi:hypothetical protein